MEWLIEQAKTASPFVAMFCLGVAALLWRQHLADQKKFDDMMATTNRAMVAAARALSKLATKIEGNNRSRR